MAVSPTEQDAWTFDQRAKSEFFHQKLHEWGLLEVAQQIEQIEGEQLEWNMTDLGISQAAWDKVIHRGVRPVVVFAHPRVLVDVIRAIGYYRMLSLVSQKSMKRLKIDAQRYEEGASFPDVQAAHPFAKHLNGIISMLIEADERIDPREFALWRGMAAGAQAQGSWQNTKGDRAEILIKGQLQSRLRSRRLAAKKGGDSARILLKDGRVVVYGDEPDVGIYAASGEILAAVEIKGGIDVAGVLERIGAAIKSLARAKEENPKAVTILVLQAVSLTEQAINDLETNRQAVNYWFTIEDVLNNQTKRNEIFGLLHI